MNGFGIFALILAVLAVGVAIWTGWVLLRGPRYIRRNAGLGVAALIAVLTLIGIGRDARAAGTGTATFGQFKIDYFTDGTSLFSIRQHGNVFLYAVLTSAQTTTLRKVYSSTPDIASGGQAPSAIDGTDTLPSCAPHLGDLTD